MAHPEENAFQNEEFAREFRSSGRHSTLENFLRWARTRGIDTAQLNSIDSDQFANPSTALAWESWRASAAASWISASAIMEKLSDMIEYHWGVEVKDEEYPVLSVECWMNQIAQLPAPKEDESWPCERW